ncbi:Light-sensor Protein kinase [Termitomyces sp. J132]|nr:Light-sensor Protein kinase [Termitomyces sp. J132]
MDSISVSPESPIDINFEVDDDDESDALSDVEFPTEFLDARTKSFPRDTLGSQDHPMNWDSYVVASAAGCSSPVVEHMDTADVEMECQVSDICEYLINVFSDFGKYTRFLRYSGNVAQDLLDLLQKLLDHAPLEPRFRAVLYVALVRLCRKSGLYPRCFSLEDVNVNLHDFPLSNGGFGEVYRANYNGEVVHDVVSGIEYLHKNGVVHGDLKSVNILVTDSERACLADFGLSYVTDASGLKGHLLSSNHAEGGTAGFEAPELVDPDIEFSRRTKASDIYAFGMVCYEMFTGERPFSKVKPVALITRIMRGQHPEKPRGELYEERGLTDDIWLLMKRCWNRVPDDRPTIAQIKQSLPRLESEWRNEEWTRSSRPGFDSTSGKVDVTLTSALPHLKSLVK